MQPEQTMSRNTIFTGKVVELQVNDVIDCNGKPMRRELVKHGGGVGIIPIDNDGNIILERQYRYGVDSIILEIPAGKLEPGEDTLSCGKRELIEETGWQASEWEDLGDMLPTPAYCGEHIRLYMASGLKFVGQHLDEHECIELVTMTLDEALRLVQTGVITDAKSQIAIMRVWIKRQTNNKAQIINGFI